MSPRKPKVLCVSAPIWAGEEYLAEISKTLDIFVSEVGDRPTTIANIEAKVKSDGPFDAICILMGTKPYEPFDQKFLQSLVPQCKIMASASAGYNEFDVEWMSEQGMIFCNSRSAVNEASADMTILMCLAVIRDTQSLQTAVAEGRWRGGLAPVPDPAGMKLGIIGMGAIGKHVARKARVFNMEIIYYQRTRMPPEDEQLYGAKYCSTLDELLETADVVSVHCPLNKNTEGLIAHKQFAKMKDGVFILNSSRGPVIDEKALIDALESGKVKRAGLDVFHHEPKINPYFIRNDRVFMQPHMGGITTVAWERAYKEALENVKAFFETGSALTPVNTAEVKSRTNGAGANGHSAEGYLSF